MKTVEKNLQIDMPRLELVDLHLVLVGDSPLIVHAWSAKAKREMLDKQMKAPKQGKVAKDPVQDFNDSLYKLADGGFGFPSVSFKAAAVSAVTSTGGTTKVAARQAFAILGEEVDITGAFEGVKMRQNLCRIEGSLPSMREDMVRVGMGTADLRYRGEFWPWHTKLVVRYNAAVLSPGQIMNLMNVAGFAVGIGEWRPEKDGQNGRFHVATDSEMASYV